MKLRVTVIVSVILIGLTACSSPGLLAETDQAGASLPSPTFDPVLEVRPSPTLVQESTATAPLSLTTPSTVELLVSSTPVPTSPATGSPSPTQQANPAPCELPPVVAPTLPADIPGYAQLDPATGLHVTGTAKEIDPTSYRLEVTGMVDNPLSLSYDDLRCLPKKQVHCELVCPGFFRDEAAWAGVPLEYVLDLAEVQDGAMAIRLIGADGYRISVSLEEVGTGDNVLAYEWEGEPLPILHGFPVRAVFPEMMGSRWVKWLLEIEVY